MAEYQPNPLWHDELSDPEHPSNKAVRAPRFTRISKAVAFAGIIAVWAGVVSVPIYEGYFNHAHGALDIPPLDPTPEPTTPDLPPTPTVPTTPVPSLLPPAPTAPLVTDPLPPEIKFDPNDPNKPIVEKPHFRPRVPVLRYVSDDRYETAKLNLGGVDTNGDDVPDGIANPIAGINDPTEDQVSAFQNSAGKGLTEGQARLALVDGGYTKGGVTYEIWESKAHPGTYYATPVNATHELVTKGVINVDTAILTPDEPTQAHSNTVDTTATKSVQPEADINERLTPEMRARIDTQFGIIDPDTQRVIPGTGVAEMMRIAHEQGRYETSDYWGPNPYTPGTQEYLDYLRMHDFLAGN